MEKSKFVELLYAAGVVSDEYEEGENDGQRRYRESVQCTEDQSADAASRPEGR